MEMFLSVCLGLGLAAACGFRVFVPLLVMSVASRAEVLSLGESFEWIGSWPAVIAFGAATLLEIAAYYIPWVDNLLDTVATPAAVVAGIVVTASVVSGMDPFLKWTLAAIAGGSLAGSVQLLTSGTRGASSITTAGFGNPIVSTVEAGGSFLLSVLALVVPVAALVAVLALLLFAGRKLFGRRALA